GAPFLDNPPLVTYFTALARLLGSDSLTWLRVANDTVWMLPAAVAVWRLAAVMFGPAAGGLALVGLYSPQRFLLEASEVKLDVPLAALAALFLWSLYRLHSTPHRAPGIACGVLAGLACLAKHQGALLPITGVVYLLIVHRARPFTAHARWVFGPAWAPAASILAGALPAPLFRFTLP